MAKKTEATASGIERLRALHKRFEHLNPILLGAANDEDPIHRAASEMWQAISAAVSEEGQKHGERD